MPTRKPTPKRTKPRSRSNVAPAGTLKASWRKLSGIQLSAVVALVVGLGVFVVWSVFAGTIINNEPESFTTSSSAGIATRNDPTAANGQYLEFLAPSAPSTPPPTTTANCPAGTTAMPVKAAEAQFKGKWPNSGNDYNDPANKNSAGVSMATGVPAGTCLTKVTQVNQFGEYVISKSGTYQNLDIYGCIKVSADDVTLLNVRATCSGYQVIKNDFGYRLRIEKVEVVGIATPTSAPADCISYNYYTAKNVNISGCQIGLKYGNETTVESSYIHNLALVCPADVVGYDGGARCSHNDGMQTLGGSNVMIRNNNINNTIYYSVSAVRIGTENSAKPKTDPNYELTSNIAVTGNRLKSGGFVVYGGAANGTNGLTNATNISITNNVIGDSSGVNYFGLVYAPTPGIIWSGNVYEATGQPANI